MAQVIGDISGGVTASPIKVSASQGGIDGGFASLRYLVTILTSFPVLFALLKAGDIVSLYGWLQSNDGVVFIAAAVAIGTPAYGIIKTWWRGRQVAAVAADPRVPASVAEQS